MVTIEIFAKAEVRAVTFCKQVGCISIISLGMTNNPLMGVVRVT